MILCVGCLADRVWGGQCVVLLGLRELFALGCNKDAFPVTTWGDGMKSVQSRARHVEVLPHSGHVDVGGGSRCMKSLPHKGLVWVCFYPLSVLSCVAGTEWGSF